MIGRQPIVHSVAVVVKTLDRLDRQWGPIVLRWTAASKAFIERFHTKFRISG